MPAIHPCAAEEANARYHVYDAGWTRIRAGDDGDGGVCMYGVDMWLCSSDASDMWWFIVGGACFEGALL